MKKPLPITPPEKRPGNFTEKDAPAERLKAEKAARVADQISETKTEGRTPRPFRTNPHD